MMSDLKFQLRRISKRNGLILAVVLAAFFLIMRAVGLGHNYWMRSLNFIFVFAAILASIKGFKKASGKPYYEEFFDLFKVGIFTSLVGIGIFSIFLVVYLGFIDVAFMDELQKYESFGGLINPVSVAFLIFLEGMGSSFICAYVAIQIQKSRTVDRPVESPSS